MNAILLDILQSLGSQIIASKSFDNIEDILEIMDHVAKSMIELNAVLRTAQANNMSDTDPRWDSMLSTVRSHIEDAEKLLYE